MTTFEKMLIFTITFNESVRSEKKWYWSHFANLEKVSCTLYEIGVISHGGADGGALNSRCHVILPVGQFFDENWSMAWLNVHVAPRHAPPMLYHLISLILTLYLPIIKKNMLISHVGFVNGRHERNPKNHWFLGFRLKFGAHLEGRRCSK